MTNDDMTDKIKRTLEAIHRPMEEGIFLTEDEMKRVSELRPVTKKTSLPHCIPRDKREIAERLLSKYQVHSSWEAHEISMLAKAWLEEHLPDDDEPVTEEWLAALRQEDGFNVSFDETSKAFYLDCYWNGFSTTITCHAKPLTRGQVRLLIKSLGGQA